MSAKFAVKYAEMLTTDELKRVEKIIDGISKAIDEVNIVTRNWLFVGLAMFIAGIIISIVHQQLGVSVFWGLVFAIIGLYGVKRSVPKAEYLTILYWARDELKSIDPIVANIIIDDIGLHKCISYLENLNGRRN